MNLTQVKTYVSGVLKGWFTNKSTLDKLSENEKGILLFNDKEISSVKISQEKDNQIVTKEDGGIYVKKFYNDEESSEDFTYSSFKIEEVIKEKTKISEKENNMLELENDGFYIGGTSEITFGVREW